MRVEFFKGEQRRYRSRLHRPDGVVVEFDGGSYNRLFGGTDELPHDLAHLIVESAFGVERGVWGVIAAGGLFRHIRVVHGRQRPHATALGRQLVKDAHQEILQAELLVRAVCDAPRPDPAVIARVMSQYGWQRAVPKEQLESAHARLADTAARWNDIYPNAPLRFDWP
jgi:hypothetical protein